MAAPTVGQTVFAIMPRVSTMAPFVFAPAIVMAVGGAIPAGSQGTGYEVDVATSLGSGSTVTVALYADRATAQGYAQPGGVVPFVASAI